MVGVDCYVSSVDILFALCDLGRRVTFKVSRVQCCHSSCLFEAGIAFRGYLAPNSCQWVLPKNTVMCNLQLDLKIHPPSPSSPLQGRSRARSTMHERSTKLSHCPTMKRWAWLTCGVHCAFALHLTLTALNSVLIDTSYDVFLWMAVWRGSYTRMRPKMNSLLTSTERDRPKWSSPPAPTHPGYSDCTH